MKRVLLGLILVVSGCFAMSRDTNHFLGVQGQRHGKLERVERAPAQRRIPRLQRYLDDEASFDQPLPYYEQARVAELEQLGSSDRAKLSEDAASGVPIVFKRRIDAVLRAQLSLGRAWLEVGDTSKAADAVNQAIVRAQRQLPTRVDRAEWLRLCFALQADIQERVGARGRARAARLQADLIADYLRSDAARFDYLDREALYHGETGTGSYQETNAVVDGVNTARLAKQAERHRRITAAASGLSAAAVRASANAQLQQNGGVMTPQIQQAMVYADMLELNAQALSGVTATGTIDVRLSLSPAASDIILTQLADPSLRVNALDLVETFTREIATVAGKPGLAEHADRARRMVGDIRALTSDDPSARVEAAHGLATELGDLIEKL